MLRTVFAAMLMAFCAVSAQSEHLVIKDISWGKTTLAEIQKKMPLQCKRADWDSTAHKKCTTKVWQFGDVKATGVTWLFTSDVVIGMAAVFKMKDGERITDLLHLKYGKHDEFEDDKALWKLPSGDAIQFSFDKSVIVVALLSLDHPLIVSRYEEIAAEKKRRDDAALKKM